MTCSGNWLAKSALNYWRFGPPDGRNSTGVPQPANRGEGAGFMFSVIRNVYVPFAKGDPDRPNVSSTIFRTVMDLTSGRY
jgi:hypothetical protein